MYSFCAKYTWIHHTGLLKSVALKCFPFTPWRMYCNPQTLMFVTETSVSTVALQPNAISPCHWTENITLFHMAQEKWASHTPIALAWQGSKLASQFNEPHRLRKEQEGKGEILMVAQWWHTNLHDMLSTVILCKKCWYIYKAIDRYDFPQTIFFSSGANACSFVEAIKHRFKPCKKTAFSWQHTM